MKECFNCNAKIKDNDKYCRNCGAKIRSNAYYILIGVFTKIVFIILIFLILLFVASYMINYK